MPLYPPDDPSLTFDPVTLPEGFSENPDPREGPRPSFGQTLGAGFAIDNEVLGAIKKLDQDNNFGDVDPNHNPWEQIQGTDMEPYGDAFLSSRNQKNTDFIASAIRDEIRNRKILEAAHPMAAFTASAIASVASPTTLIPGGAIYRGVKVGRAAAKSGLTVGAANAAAAGLQEAALHAQQYTRTGTESAFAVGGSFLLAALLGSAVSGMSSRAFRNLTTKLETDLQIGKAIDNQVAAMRDQGHVPSAGAASAAAPPVEVKSAFGLEKLDVLGPSGRGMGHEFPSMREFTAEMVEYPGMTTRNADGFTTAPRGGSIEGRIKTQGEARLGAAVMISDDAWRQYRFGKSDPSFSERIGALGTKPPGKLTEKEFRQEMGKALVRNDEHAIPEIQKAVRKIRKEVIQPIAEDAIKLKKLDVVEVTKNLPNWLKKELRPQAAAPAAIDPNLRASLDSMLSRVEEMTGQKIDSSMRDRALEALSGNEDLLRRLREVFTGEQDVPFALRDQPVGRTLDDILDDLEDGRPVALERDFTDRMERVLLDVRDGLPDVARQVPMHFMIGVEPVGDGNVEVLFRGLDGGISRLTLPVRQFANARAAEVNGRILTFQSEFVGNVDHVLMGEVKHELAHALRRRGVIGEDVFNRLVAHAETLRILDMPLRDFLAATGADTSRAIGGATIRSVYTRHYMTSSFDGATITAKLDEEALAHMAELRAHGKLSDEDLGPVLADMDALFGRPVPAGQGRQAAVDDWMRQLGDALKVDGNGGVSFAMRGDDDAETGQSMRRDLDRLGYFSGALEAAKRLRQAKGTPEQMLAMLKEEGAKKAEIEATNLKSLFDGKSSVTKQEIIKHLEKNRVGLKEVVRTQPKSSYNDHNTKWSPYSLDPSNPTYRETVLHLPSHDAQMRHSRRALQGEFNSLQDRYSGRGEPLTEVEAARMETLRGELISNTSASNAARADDFQSGHFPEPNIVGHTMTSMVKHEGKATYLIDQIQSDWGQNLRDGGVRDEAKIAELKSKIAEAKRQHPDQFEVNGFGGRKIFETRQQAHAWILEKAPKQKGFFAKKPEIRDDVLYLPGVGKIDVRAVVVEHDVVKRLRAELSTAEAATPGHPLVNTTDQWVNTVLRRAIRQAVEADAEYIAIPSGKTVLSYNPGDEAGMEGFYNDIVPKNLKNLLRKIDKQSPDPVVVDKVQTPTPIPRDQVRPSEAAAAPYRAEWDGLNEKITEARERLDQARREMSPMYAGIMDEVHKLENAREELHGKMVDREMELSKGGMRGNGFTLFKLTDKVKQSVKEQGQPMFAMRDLSRRLDAPLVDDLAKADKHPGRVMAVHGTKAQPFDQFDPAKSADFGIHFGTRDQADIPAGYTTTRENARMIPVVLDLKTVVDVPDMMTWPPVEVAEAVEKAYPLARGLTERVRAAIAQGPTETGPTGSVRPSREALAAGKEELRRLMSEANIDGLRYWNDSEGEGWSYIVWDQGKVTSATSGEPMMGVSNSEPQFAPRQQSKGTPDPRIDPQIVADVRAVVARISDDVMQVAQSSPAMSRDGDGNVMSVKYNGQTYTITRGDDGSVASVTASDEPMAGAVEIGHIDQQLVARVASPIGDLIAKYGGTVPDAGAVVRRVVAGVVEGRPLETVIAREIQSVFPPNVAPAMMLAVRGELQNVLKTIRELGGIKDEGGDLANMGAGERRGIINNETGLSPDAMRAHMIDRGYLQDVTQSSVNDLYDLIGEALADNGGAQRAYREELAFQALRAAQKFFKDEVGVDLKLTPEQESQLVSFILDQRMSVDDALERIGMMGGDQKASGPQFSDPMRDINARRVMQEINDFLDDGSGDDVFSAEIADEVWGDGGESYGPRVWDRPRVIAKRPTVRDIIADYFEEAQGRAEGLLARLMRDMEKLETAALPTGKPAKIQADMMKNIEGLQQFTSLSRQDLESTADQVIDHILGLQDGRMMMDLPKAVRGSLKARTLRIPDLFESANGRIEDFFDRDINVMMRQYVRSTVPDLEIVRRFGGLDLKEQFARIGDDFKRMSERLVLSEHQRAGMSPDQIAKHERLAERERSRLEKARRKAERDLVGMISRLRGERMDHMDPTAISTRTLRGFRQWNLITMLGGMTVSALPDIFRPMMVHGVRSYFMDGLRPLLTNISTVKKAGAETKTFGTALDLELNTRLQAFADVVDDYGRYSKFERGLGYATEKFGVLSLMNGWNASLKRIAGMMAMTNVIRMTQKVATGAVTPKEIEKLAAAGLDAFDARVVAAQFAKHGSIEGGVYLPNTKAWDVSDPNVRMALDSFKGAIVRDVDRAIVTPGQEKPLFMSTEAGATLMQFKTFGLASFQRTLVAGLQQRDSGVILGAMLSIGMGMVVEHLKALMNDKPLPKSDAQWIAAGLDRSGLLAYISDVNNLLEKGSGGTLGIGALTGKELSRYASRNAMDALMGPSVGRGADIFAVTSGFSRALAGKDQVRESDIATFRRLVPFQNLFYLSYIFQKLEQAVSKGVGAKPSKHRSPLMDRLSSNDNWLDEIVGVA